MWRRTPAARRLELENQRIREGFCAIKVTVTQFHFLKSTPPTNEWARKPDRSRPNVDLARRIATRQAWVQRVWSSSSAAGHDPLAVPSEACTWLSRCPRLGVLDSTSTINSRRDRSRRRRTRGCQCGGAQPDGRRCTRHRWGLPGSSCGGDDAGVQQRRLGLPPGQPERT